MLENMLEKRQIDSLVQYAFEKENNILLDYFIYLFSENYLNWILF